MSRYSARVETLRDADRRSGYSPYEPFVPGRSWSRKDVVGLACTFALGLLFVAGWGQSVALGVMGVGLLGFVVIGATIYVLRDRYLTAPAPEITQLDGAPATVVHREPVAFLMGLVVIWDMVLVTLVWAVLAAPGSPLLAVVLALPTAWAAWFTLLVARGRFTAGGVWLTPDKLVYRSRGLHVEILWDGIDAADGTAVPALSVLHVRPDAVVLHRNVPAPWRSERMASPTMAVVRTDDMIIDPGSLVRLVARYALDPAARTEIGTVASVRALEGALLTSSSGPLPAVFARRTPEHPGT